MIHLLHDERRRGYIGKEHKEASHLGHDGKSEARVAEHAEQIAVHLYHTLPYAVGRLQRLRQKHTAHHEHKSHGKNDGKNARPRRNSGHKSADHRGAHWCNAVDGT